MRQILFLFFERWWFVFGFILFSLFIACSTIEEKKTEYQFLTESHSGLGMEANRDPLILGRLFDLPVNFYQNNKQDSEKHEKSWLGITMRPPNLPERDHLGNKTSAFSPNTPLARRFLRATHRCRRKNATLPPAAIGTP